MKLMRSKHYKCHHISCNFEMYVLSRYDTSGLKRPIDSGYLVVPVKRQDKKWWKL